MRYLSALAIAGVSLFVVFWVGSRVVTMVAQPHRDQNDFTVGARFDLCGYTVDSRYALAGYDLNEWRGDRCDQMSQLDHCVLGCLSVAGTVETASACYSDCLAE